MLNRRAGVATGMLQKVTIALCLIGVLLVIANNNVEYIKDFYHKHGKVDNYAELLGVEMIDTRDVKFDAIDELDPYFVRYVDIITAEIFENINDKNVHTYTPFPVSLGDKYGVKFVDDGDGIKVFILGPVGIYPYKDYNDLEYLRGQHLGILKSGGIYDSKSRCVQECKDEGSSSVIADCRDIEYASKESLSMYYLLKSYCHPLIDDFSIDQSLDNRVSECVDDWPSISLPDKHQDKYKIYENVKSIEISTAKNCDNETYFQNDLIYEKNYAELAWVKETGESGYNHLFSYDDEIKSFSEEKSGLSFLEEKRLVVGSEYKWVSKIYTQYVVMYKTDTLVLSIEDDKNTHIFIPQVVTLFDNVDVSSGFDSDEYFGHGYIEADSAKLIVDNIGKCT
jgi:hypothetical protein